MKSSKIVKMLRDAREMHLSNLEKIKIHLNKSKDETEREFLQYVFSDTKEQMNQIDREIEKLS